MPEKEQNQEQLNDQTINNDQVEMETEKIATNHPKEKVSDQPIAEASENKETSEERIDGEEVDVAVTTEVLDEEYVEEVVDAEEGLEHSEEETEELLEEIEEATPLFSRKLLLILLGVAICLSGICLFLFYPFAFKLSGNWVSSNVSNIEFNVSGSQAEFKMENNDVAGMTIVYAGRLHPEGVNSYRYADVKVQVFVDKTQVTSEELDTIKETAGDTYNILKETKSQLAIEYKEKAANQLFEGYNKEKIATIKGPMIYWPSDEMKLTINSQYLYQDLIQMKKEE